ncbi:MAG: RelA/SpoT family protein [Bradymonadia bacterium]
MVRLEDVVNELKRHHPDADTGLVQGAYIFSAMAHEGQTRRSGEPYLTHPLEVSYIVARLRMDPASVAAALLHDTIEDTVATVEQLETQFGKDVAFLVEGLTKLEKIKFSNAEEAQAENFRKMVVAMSRDLRVIVVKLADRLHNMRTLTHLRPDKQKRISRETLEIYAPLANRLGIAWAKTELEDLSFKYLYPEEYRSLAELIKKTRREREAYIEKVKGLIDNEMKRHGIHCEIYGRPKHLWSIHQKIKKSETAFENLYDILAFRILVDEVGSCYEALGHVHSLWKPVPGRFKDYIALPKPNGYRSLHTSVLGPDRERFEIQVRTEEMHRTAEYGIAAHWSYKEANYGMSASPDRKFDWLRQLLEWQQDLKDPNDFMQTVKVDLFNEEVYVFTPQSDVKAFPRGATPLDFAYSIHTDLGHECSGAKVNGRMVKLNYKLQNGDIIEILRTPGNKPNQAWLKIVKTGRAAAKIRNYIRQEAREQALQVGQEMLDQALKRYDLTFNKVRKTGKLESCANKNKYRTINEMVALVGYGKLRVDALLPDLVPAGRLESGPAEKKPDSPIKKLIKKVLPKPNGGIVVDGVEGVATTFPKCCNPVHGEEVVGFVTRVKGVVIHRKDCPRALDYDPACKVQVSWSSRSRAARDVEIRVLTSDTSGMLASISQSFYNAGINITAVNCYTTGDTKAVNNFTVQVADSDQLQKVLNNIQRIDGVTEVVRVEG